MYFLILLSVSTNKNKGKQEWVSLCRIKDVAILSVGHSCAWNTIAKHLCHKMKWSGSYRSVHIVFFSLWSLYHMQLFSIPHLFWLVSTLKISHGPLSLGWKGRGAYSFMESQWTTSDRFCRLLEVQCTAVGESQAQGRHTALKLYQQGESWPKVPIQK